MSQRAFAIGVDIGGTCTDVAMLDLATNEHFFYKTETVPHDVASGVVNGISGLLAERNRQAADCIAFIHGTTLALNSVLTREGARVGLLVTRGFADLLEIGRLQMPDPFNFYTRKAQPLVRKACVREVEERILGSGDILTPVDTASVERAADELIERGAEILTICFINAFRNPVHEQQAAALIRARHPGVRVSLSSEVWPEIREYERALVTVMNAFVTPKVASYLDQLRERVSMVGLAGSVNITTSNGGMLPIDLARERPGTTLMSGPASGVIASARLAEQARLQNVIAFDMGGTSSDFAVLLGHQIPYSTETRIGDLPVVFPSVDVVSVGAGGGSIARLDNLGILKVGPESAGANPGPACYGRGGTLPTVTDAYLVTGILSDSNFLGGAVRLDPALARSAIGALAERSGYTLDELAEGILRVAASNMVLGIGAIEGRIGFDIRDFALLAYGGAGPTHACMLAEEVGIREVVVPRSPGTFCALGSLSADFRLDFVQTLSTPLRTPDWTRIRDWYASKEDEAARLLKPEVSIERLVALRSVDVRYEGQGFNTEVPLAPEVLAAEDSVSLASAFASRYEQLYGVSQAAVPGEIVNLRLTVIGQRQHARAASATGATTSPQPAASRSVYFGGARRTIPVFRRDELPTGTRLTGPCVVDQVDTTTFIRPGWSMEADEHGNLRLRRETGQ